MFLLVFKTKHTKTNDTSTSLSFTQHNSYFVKNKIIILFLLVFLLILLAIDKCNRASSLAISVSQHCERAFRTPIICLYAPYMKRHSLRRSIESKEGHKTTGASTNIFSILYLLYRSIRSRSSVGRALVSVWWQHMSRFQKSGVRGATGRPMFIEHPSGYGCGWW